MRKQDDSIEFSSMRLQSLLDEIVVVKVSVRPLFFVEDRTIDHMDRNYKRSLRKNTEILLPTLLINHRKIVFPTLIEMQVGILPILPGNLHIVVRVFNLPTALHVIILARSDEHRNRRFSQGSVAHKLVPHDVAFGRRRPHLISGMEQKVGIVGDRFDLLGDPIRHFLVVEWRIAHDKDLGQTRLVAGRRQDIRFRFWHSFLLGGGTGSLLSGSSSRRRRCCLSHLCRHNRNDRTL
mmetsp:Transcript_12026/g.34391  ORF Transcript_12026/g.34391 Transcript_12026/m.34391 type:complete len:236 (+) Transcript_12026:1072-1779(+)